MVDDGSTDGSLDVIQSFGGAIRWTSGPNRRAGAARNCGLELAQGELIQFLDADDYLNSEKLERQVPLVTAGTADIIYSDWLTLEIGAAEPVYCSCPLDADDPLLMTLSDNFQTAAPIHRKRWLEAVGSFREDLPYSEERDLHIRLAARGLTFHRLPEALLSFRRTPGSLGSNIINALDQHAAILTPIYEDLASGGQLGDERARAFAALIARDARRYLDYGLNEKALAYFRLATVFHPRGGLKDVYTAPTRLLHRVLGPVWTHRLVRWKRGGNRKAASAGN